MELLRGNKEIFQGGSGRRIITLQIKEPSNVPTRSWTKVRRGGVSTGRRDNNVDHMTHEFTLE